MTRIEIGGDGTDAKGKMLKPFKITIEVNLSQTVLRAIVQYKWMILVQVLCLVTHRVAINCICKNYPALALPVPEWIIDSLPVLVLSIMNAREMQVYQHLPITLFVLSLQELIYILAKGRLAMLLTG